MQIIKIRTYKKTTVRPNKQIIKIPACNSQQLINKTLKGDDICKSQTQHI